MSYKQQQAGREGGREGGEGREKRHCTSTKQAVSSAKEELRRRYRSACGFSGTVVNRLWLHRYVQ